MDINFIISSVGVFLAVILLLVVILLLAKKFLSPSGKVTITINGDKQLNVDQGSSIMATLNENGIYLPSACGGKASCGQCKLQVLSGGGEILDSERPHFTRKQIKENWRLGCQCKVKGDMSVKVPRVCDGRQGVGVHRAFQQERLLLHQGVQGGPAPGRAHGLRAGSYAQIKIPAYDCIDYDKDFDKNDIGEDYIAAWKNFNIFSLKARNPEPTIRAYSMANYPAEGDIITLTVRIATTPFKPRPEVGFQDVPTGIGSSYIFSLKPWRQGDDVSVPTATSIPTSSLSAR